MVTEVGRMADRWPADTDFALWELDVLDRSCSACGRLMHICDHRYRRFHTLDGPVQLICKLNHGPDPACPGHARTKSPELEITLALPQMAIGWDVFCWIGQRRCSRHMAISLIRSELLDDYGIKLSDDAIEQYIRRYQVMLAARQQDAESLRRHYESAAEIILCIDGLQPEKGHEALYVVRELTRKRVWFAEPLLSATEDEVRRLIRKARQWAESLGTPVGLWMSDKQAAFVTGIAAEFPDGPHRSCDNHFLRDLARPVLDADSHAKVRMRKRVRGLRTIEQAVLPRQKAGTKEGLTSQAPGAPGIATAADRPPADVDPAGSVVRDYRAAVRGILNDDQGGPLHPSGVRMAEALSAVQASLRRNLEAQRGDSRKSNSAGYRGTSRRAWTKSESSRR
jgi:hypothetical protein